MLLEQDLCPKCGSLEGLTNNNDALLPLVSNSKLLLLYSHVTPTHFLSLSSARARALRTHTHIHIHIPHAQQRAATRPAGRLPIIFLDVDGVLNFVGTSEAEGLEEVPIRHLALLLRRSEHVLVDHQPGDTTDSTSTSNYYCNLSREMLQVRHTGSLSMPLPSR